MLATTPTAAISPQIIPMTDRKKVTVVGTVLALKLVKKKARANSFHDWITQKIAVAAIPGSVKGKTIFVRTLRREQPSIKAASSISWGISSMNPRIIHIVNGMLKLRYTMARRMWVSSRPKKRPRRKKGITTAMGGSIRRERIQKAMSSFREK